MKLQVDVQFNGAGFYSAALAGRLDSETYTTGEEALAPVLEARPKLLLLDLTGLNYLSSMGLRVILAARQTLEDGGGEIVVGGLQPSVKSILDISRVVPPEVLFNTVEEAESYIGRLREDSGSASGKSESGG